MKKWIPLIVFLSINYLNAQKPELVIERDGHIAEVEHVCFSPDERQALSGGRDNRLVLWDLDSRKFVRFIQMDTTPEFLCFGPGGQTAVALLADKSLYAWNLENGLLLWSVKPQDYLIAVQQGDSLLFSHPDNTLSSRDLKSGAIRWQGMDNTQVQPPKTPTPGLSKKLEEIGEMGINEIAFALDGSNAVVAIGTPTNFWWTTPGQPPNRSGYGALLVWNLETDMPAFPLFELPEMIHDIALSRDATRCLLASSDGIVRLWDLAYGKELFLLEREPAFETRFSLSPDFRRIALARLDNTLKIFNLDQRNSLVSKINYRDANTFQFTGDSKDLLVADRKGTIIRRSGATLDSVLLFQHDRHMEVIHSLAISPDGKKLIAGSSKESRVMFWSVDTLNKKAILRYIKNDQKETIGFETIAGKIYGTPNDAGFSDEPNPDVIYFQPNVNVSTIWDLEKGQLEQVLYPYDHEGWIYNQQMAFSPDGRFAMANMEGEWLAWDTHSGDKIQNKKGNHFFNAIHFDDQGGHALSIMPNGSLSKWNITNGAFEESNLRFKKIVATTFHSSGEKGLALDKNGMLWEWDAQTGEPIRQLNTSKTFEIAELAYAPIDNFILIRSKGEAEIWDLETGSSILALGQEANEPSAGDEFWDDHKPDQVNLFAFLPDGHTALSGRFNGMLEFWDFREGKKIATLFLKGTNDWVVTTPSGLFDASDGAMKNMYFRLGTEILELEQLKERYFEPGLLQKLLGFVQGGLRPVEAMNHIALYPKILKAAIEADRIKVELQPREGGIGKVSLLLNDKIELDPNVNPEFKSGFEVDLRRFEPYFFTDTINRLSLRAYNQDGWLKGQPYPLFYNTKGEKGEPLKRKLSSLSSKKDSPQDPINLYAIVVGTSQFRGSKLNLKYPDKDAAAFAEALQLAGEPLFGDNIEIKLLTTSADPFPRKSVIAKAFAEIAAKSDPNDILLVYFSGHGITYPENSEKGQFYYLTTDILDDKLDDPFTLNTQAIAQDTLQEWIRNVKALKRILILDACNSGKVVQSMEPGQKALNSDQRRALERMNDRSGMFVLAGSAADKSSFEASRYGHGLLTYSLLNNMPFVAASNRTLIDISKLFNSTLEEVPKLALEIGKVQQPELIASESFDIGSLDPLVKFPIPQALPVFVRTVFMDSQQNKDLQRLAKAVNSHLNELAGDKQPEMVYWDIDEFSGDHYYLGGLYQVTGETLSGLAALYRKDDLLATFPFTGPKDQLDMLAEQIVDQAFEKLNATK